MSLRLTEEQVAEHLARVRGKKPEPPEPPEPPLPTEHEEQVAFVQWFRLRYPDTLMFAIPNGGTRHKKTAADLKAEGVLPGVPDLFIPEWRLWIEMKRQKGGRVSEEQETMIGYLVEAGYACIVAHGAEDAIRLVEK